ncbi:unnamed protein product [Dibothriocephalus latus]|uniref:Uncharacterized protein n=1 Tax=Dibothriocephalus latus TaxID=60516 RepID=A0A3P7KUP5_DIBLA|nr:unnamed protein product [Dibothriocephalus latus]
MRNAGQLGSLPVTATFANQEMSVCVLFSFCSCDLSGHEALLIGTIYDAPVTIAATTTGKLARFSLRTPSQSRFSSSSPSPPPLPALKHPTDAILLRSSACTQPDAETTYRRHPMPSSSNDRKRKRKSSRLRSSLSCLLTCCRCCGCRGCCCRRCLSGDVHLTVKPADLPRNAASPNPPAASSTPMGGDAVEESVLAETHAPAYFTMYDDRQARRRERRRRHKMRKSLSCEEDLPVDGGQASLITRDGSEGTESDDSTLRAKRPSVVSTTTLEYAEDSPVFVTCLDDEERVVEEEEDREDMYQDMYQSVETIVGASDAVRS